MPSTTQKQHNFMALCAHSPQHAKGKCPPQGVASEFVAADRAMLNKARDKALKGGK